MAIRESTLLDAEVSGPIRVIIADDHPMVRAGLRALLDVPDIEVVSEAESGAVAVEQAARYGPDVVLMDVRMEGGDGLTATRIIRDSLPSTRILVVTSFEDGEYLRSAVRAGASGFILKQASRSLLLDSIRTVHAGGSTFPLEMMDGLLAPGASASALGATDSTRPGVLTVGDLVIDPERHLVVVNGRQIALTYLEFRAIVALAQADGEILSHGDLQRVVWPDQPEEADPHRVVSLIARLRSRLGPGRMHLQTIKRVGYRLAPPADG